MKKRKKKKIHVIEPGPLDRKVLVSTDKQKIEQEAQILIENGYKEAYNYDIFFGDKPQHVYILLREDVNGS